MTKKQAEQFNYMKAQLIKISKAYMTPQQIEKAAKKDEGYGPGYQETLEMSYENIQLEAARAVKGVKSVIIPSK